jgi:hypothetical protein
MLGYRYLLYMDFKAGRRSTHGEDEATGFRVLVVVATGLLQYEGPREYWPYGGIHRSYQITLVIAQKVAM